MQEKRISNPLKLPQKHGFFVFAQLSWELMGSAF